MRKTIVLALILMIVVIAAAAALATPGSGGSVVTLAAGTFDERLNINHDGIKLQTRKPVDVVMQEITWAPGATSGWHSHPGVVLVLVKSPAEGQPPGILEYHRADCTTQTLTVGDVLIESSERPAVLHNHGATSVVVDVTFVVPTGVPLRIDFEPAPCGIA